MLVRVYRVEVVVASGDRCRQLGRLLVLVALLCNLDLRRATPCVIRPLAAVALKQCVHLLLLLAVVTIDAVAATFVAQIRVVSPLLGARTPGQYRRLLVVRAGLLVNELSLSYGLLETLSVLHVGVLMIGLSDVVTELLKVERVLMDARHYVLFARSAHLWRLAIVLLRPLRLKVLLVADDAAERRSVYVVLVVLHSAALDRLAHILSLVQIVRQMLNLSLVHAELSHILS